MAQMDLEIISPDKVLAKETQVKSILIPAKWGQMEILPDYADFVTILSQGSLVYKKEGNENSFQITGGLLTIVKNQVTILVDGTLATVTPITQNKK